MNIELFSVGTELLLGDILNTNVQYISKELANLGMNIYRQTTVGDNMERLVNNFRKSFNEVDIIITTGGLGPTTDDITKEAAAKFFGQDLILFEEQWKKIENICAKFSGNKKNIPSNNKKQALFTEDAVIIPNYNGTAPGAIFEKDGKRIIILPGPPNEMIPMFKDFVIPYLEKESNNIFYSKYIRFFGIGESKLEIELKEIVENQNNPTVALYAKQGEVMIRVTAKAKNKDAAKVLVENKIDEIKNVCGDYIYLIGDENISSSQTELHNVVYNLLRKNNLTISTAESCTGGLVVSQLIDCPGISNYVIEGAVTYSNSSKIKRLGVSEDTLRKYGAVSSETAIEMAKGVALNSGSDIGISATGIAGPDGGSDEKPVGLVYFGFYFRGNSFSEKKIFTGNRERIRLRASREALNIVRKELIKL